MYTRLLPTFGVFFGLVCFGTSNRLFAQANADVVISQVYTGGGYIGSTWLRDYVEIYNRSTVTVDISSWAIQYAVGNNSTWKPIALKGTTLESGQYFLIEFGATGTKGAPLPQYDASTLTDLNTTAGKLALTRTTTMLTGDPVGGLGTDIVDFVGYGTIATVFEGTAPATAPTLDQAIFRLENGLIDTGNNDTDFELLAANPRNSSNFQPVPEPLTTGIIALSVAGGVLLRNRFRRKKICQT